MEKERIIDYINMMLDGLRDSRQYDLEQATGATEIGMKMYHDGKVHAYDNGISKFELLKELIESR